MWCQNFISVSSGAKVAGDVHQLSFSAVGYGTPHHHTFSAEIFYLKDAVPCEPLISSSVDTCTAISFLQHESWFIDDSDSPSVLQVPAPYSVAPSDPWKSMLTSQYCAKVSRFHWDYFWLCRYSSETCCFSCCHGPVSQMKYPDVAILGCWCDPRSARTVTVSCWTGLLVPLQDSGNRAPLNIIKSSDCILWFTGMETTNDDVPGSCRGGSRGGGGCTRRAPPLKLEKNRFFGVKSWFFTRYTAKIYAPSSAIGKNMIFWRKIVIFHTKYPNNFRASLHSAQFF